MHQNPAILYRCGGDFHRCPAKSRESLRPQDARFPCNQNIASARPFSLRLKGTKLIPTAEVPTMPRVSSENRYLTATRDFSGAKKASQSQKFARTAPRNFLNNSRGLPVITQQNLGFSGKSHQKSSPESSAKSSSHSFFVIPFLSPNFHKIRNHP